MNILENGKQQTSAEFLGVFILFSYYTTCYCNKNHHKNFDALKNIM